MLLLPDIQETLLFLPSVESWRDTADVPRIIPERTHCWKRRWPVWYGGKRFGKSSPRRACAQKEQYAVEHLTPVAPRAAAPVLRSLWFRDQGVQARPLRVA